MSEHKWKTGDRAIYDFDFNGRLKQCTIIGWNDPRDNYIVRFDNPRWGLYGHGLGVATEEFLRPIPRTVEHKYKWKTGDKTNTRLRNAVLLRPVVAVNYFGINESILQNSYDEAKTAWTGDETAYGFLYRLMLTARYAEDTPRDHTTVIRKALIRCGAWVALALSLLDEEESR